MPTFSKKIMSQYLRAQCERQLKLNLYNNTERKNLGMPEEDKIRGQIGLLTEEGMQWQAKVLGHLDATFGSSSIIGHRKPGQQNEFDKTPLIQLINQIQANCFIVEAKYEIEVPSQIFRQALNLTSIVDYNGDQLKFAAAIPDLIQVFDPTDRFSSDYVTPGGEVKSLPIGDSRRQLRIIDIKLTSEPGANYFAEVAYYAMTLAGWLVDNQLDTQFVVVPQAAVWPGSHQASKLRKKMNEWQQQGYNPSFRDLIQAMEDDIEVVEFDIFAPLIRRLLQEKIPTILAEPNWTAHEWHVSAQCNSCDFLGYPWGQNRNNPPTPDPKHCWLMAQTQNHLSRVAYISRGSSSVLRGNGIPDVHVLAQQDGTHDAFQQHQELRSQRTVFPSRAKALMNSHSFIAPSSGTSAVMPKWADLKIFISTEFDLSSGISFSFGIKAFWYEPFLNLQRQYKNWNATVFFVGNRSIQQEEPVFINFLQRIREILSEVEQQDQADRVTGRRTKRSKVQFYIWDSIQQDHFMRVIGRHLDAILSDRLLKDLAWLFPPEEIIPNPDLSTRQSPITIVSEVVRQHLAVPVPHAYTLLQIVQHYHRQQDAKDISYMSSISEYFQDPLSDLIPSERGHEIWVQKQPKGDYPGYAFTLRQFENTVKIKLRALEMVTNRLREDLNDVLSNQNAPVININSPEKLPTVNFDAQLWYTFARLDAELDKLENQQIRAMPPHEREARFKSARLHTRLSGEEKQNAINHINQQFSLQLQSVPERYVYQMHINSCDVSLKPGDFTYAVAPEGVVEFLDQKFSSVVSGSPLEDQYQINPYDRRTLQDMLGVTVEAIDRDRGIIVLSKVSDRYPTVINDLEAYRLLDLSHDVILDPVSHDFFTRKLEDVLVTIGNPRIAKDNPLVKRALGMQEKRRSPTTPPSPIADFLWNAPAMQTEKVSRSWKQAARLLRQNGIDLNISQWRALAYALNRRLALIWGPPGTGKSHTLQCLVMIAAIDAWNQGGPLRILITAGTYTAIDNVLLKVADTLSSFLPNDGYELKRIRSKYRSSDGQSIERGIDIQLNRSDPSQEIRNLRERLLNRQGITIVGMPPEQVFNFMKVGEHIQEELFDLIVLDEASQMDTAHAILPLCSIARNGCLILAGDDLQLAPIQKAEPPKNLEHMVGSVYNFYKHHHSIKERPLNTNYRSNNTIVDFSIRAGYKLSLHAYSPNLRIKMLSEAPFTPTPPSNWPVHLYWTPEWKELIEPDKPITCFIHDDIQSSQSNSFEADAVAAIAWLFRDRLSTTDHHYGLLNELDKNKLKPTSTEIYSEENFWERGLGIVTPHKAQMGRIITTLTQTFPNISPSIIRGAVDTVERFQGQQRDIIIGSFALGDPDAIRNRHLS